MNRNKKLKKALVCSLAGSMAITNVMPAYANTQYTNSSTSVEKTQTTTKDDNLACDVYAELGSTFKVTIPKKVTLDGATKKGTYNVTVEGDIAGLEVVNVTPDEAVTLSSKDKADVIGSITQDKTAWTYNQILSDNKVIGNGEIDANKITAGAWNGTFNFNIKLTEDGVVTEDPTTLEAGLYDANGNMLCTWEESGIDVEKDYSSTSTEENYYETTETSGYYVLTNNYPTTTKVVIPEGVTSIGERSFLKCTNLISVEIPKGVKSIGQEAFEYCSNLTSVILPEDITHIYLGVFSFCTKLSNITIPNSVEYIGGYAFYDCTSLTSIEIPDSVAKINSDAFRNVPHIIYNGTATGSPWGALAIN